MMTSYVSMQAFYVNAALEEVKMSIYFLEMQSKLNDETLSLHLTK